jgi:hypothetical protein
MKNKLILGVLLFSTSIFANNIELINKLDDAQYQLKAISEPIGIDAKTKFDKKEDQLLYIKKECKNILEQFSYIGDTKIVFSSIYPNCIEYSMEKLK